MSDANNDIYSSLADLLVESFNPKDLLKENDGYKKAQEGQRHINEKFLAVFLKAMRLPPPKETRIQSNWQRGTQLLYANNPLGWKGSLTSQHRFSERGSPALYFAENAPTVVYELTDNDFFEKPAHIFPAAINLSRAIDLSTFGELNEMLRSDALADWEFSQGILDVTPVHVMVAEALRNLGYEGILYESFQKEANRQKCLVVYPDKLVDGSYVKILNPTTNQKQTILNPQTSVDFDLEHK